MKKYIPSNGAEGEWFFSKFCFHCLHERFLLTNNDADKKCEILTNTLLFDIEDEKYTSEWTYDKDGNPTCTNYKYWDWDNDGDPDDPENPKSPPVYDPNQISFPFIEALEVDEINKEAVLQTITNMLNLHCIEKDSETWKFAENLIKAFEDV